MGATLAIVDVERPTRRWYSAIFEQEPLSDGQYILLLVFIPVVLAVLLVGVVAGMWWLFLLSQLFFGVVAVVTVYRERQRRMRVRAARLETYRTTTRPARGI
jgi:uncharacterized ion transporter superfamily protein YfcC